MSFIGRSHSPARRVRVFASLLDPVTTSLRQNRPMGQKGPLSASIDEGHVATCQFNITKITHDVEILCLNSSLGKVDGHGIALR